MEFYSNSKPNLIDNKIREKVDKIIRKKIKGKYTISEKISNLMSYLYKTFIKEHKGLVILLIIIALFLIYRYYNKVPKKEKYVNSTSILDDITKSITKHLMYNTQPSFDRLQSVNDQEVKVNYPPDPLPINLEGNVVMAKDLYPTTKFPTLNTPKYDYNNVYRDPSLSYYTGTYNPYQNAQDTDILNPLGYPNDENTATGRYITQMTDQNQQNILDYQTILDGKDYNLKTGLLHGGQYIKYNDPCLNIKPPYSEDYY